MLFSLIVPTLNRREEVQCLLASIEAQTCRDFEVIIVDLNNSDLLDAVCRDFATRLPLRHIKAKNAGAAAARNHGLPFAQGEIINFPDDDCEFTPDLLERVREGLRQNPSVDALFARAVDPASGQGSVIKSSGGSQTVTPDNIYRTTVEFTMFARRQLFDDVGLLDERLGVGTYFGAEEGADFVLRALYQGKHLHYDPELLIYHPQKVMRYDTKETSRAYNYGKGFGRLSVKHARLYRRSDAIVRFAIFQTRSAVAALVSLCLFKFNRCKYYLMVVSGRWVGVVRSWGEFSGKQASP